MISGILPHSLNQASITMNHNFLSTSFVLSRETILHSLGHQKDALYLNIFNNRNNRNINHTHTIPSHVSFMVFSMADFGITSADHESLGCHGAGAGGGSDNGTEGHGPQPN